MPFAYNLPLESNKTLNSGNVSLKIQEQFPGQGFIEECRRSDSDKVEMFSEFSLWNIENTGKAGYSGDGLTPGMSMFA